MKIDQAHFTTAELSAIAGVDRKLADLWIERDLISPTETMRVGRRNRISFSVIEIFKARLIALLSAHIWANPSFSVETEATARRYAKRGAVVPTSDKRLARVLADEGWMWAVGRSVDRNDPIQLYAAISHANGEWRFFIEMDAAKLAMHFVDGECYIVIPIGSIFAAVYQDCRKIYEARTIKARHGLHEQS